MTVMNKRLAGKAIVKVVPWGTHKSVLNRIRTVVFVNEQGVAPDIVSDDQDGDCTHFLLEDDGYAIGCGRLQPSGKLERMAVLMTHRNRGLGAEMLTFMIEYAREKGFESLHLHAQIPARSYYERAGFKAGDDVFLEAGIEHVDMHFPLAQQTPGFISGVTYPQPFAKLAIQLAQGARRSLRIYSPNLDHEVFDNNEWSEAISALIRRGRDTRVQILVTDSAAIVKRGHRVLNIARRLSSSVSIRKLDEHPELTDACYVIRDLDGIIYKPEEHEKPGFFEPDSRASCLRFIESFDLFWEQSREDPELRQLSM